MNNISIFTLKVIRKFYTYLPFSFEQARPISEKNPDRASNIMYEKLLDDSPCMIARFGSTELATIVNYLGIKNGVNVWDYVRGKSLPWWWETGTLRQMQEWSGFFPVTENNIERFCELMLADTNELDILGSWLTNENHLNKYLTGVTYVEREIQNPFFVEEPWTKALYKKKVLVVHPFAELIEYQYRTNRQNLFSNKCILPEFELKTIKAVQSLGGDNSEFSNWFEALEWMKSEIDKLDYDICLLGCGAYGFPLAAHVKRQGKKSIHLGGSLQLLFGIKGKRWENPNYNEKYNYHGLMNKYWVKPGDEFKPKNSESIEGGCYW